MPESDLQPAPKIGDTASKRAVREAAILVGARYDLDADEVLSSRRTAAISEARWVLFHVLYCAGWNAERISDVTTFARSTVDQALLRIERRMKNRSKPGLRLKAIVESCLREAAGGSP